MKKRKILIIATLIALLTGCSMKMNIGFKIDKDKKLSFQMLEAMDNEMIDAMINFNSYDDNEDEFNDATDEQIDDATDEQIDDPTDEQNNVEITDEMRWKYLEEAFQNNQEDAKLEKYEKDNFKGFIITKEISNIDDASTSNPADRVDINEETFEFKNLFIKNGDVYKSNLSMKKNEEYSSFSQYETMGAVFDIKFVVTLPNKSISNNADMVSSDGLTLTWDLLKNTSEQKNIDFEFKFGDSSSSSNLITYIGIAALLIIIIIVIILLSQKKSKQKTSKNIEDNTTLKNENIDNYEQISAIKENENVEENTDTQSSNLSEKICPNCGTKVSSHYCENCGHKMD